MSRQVLAEPEEGLPAKTWARLADGTPLVTAERRGPGSLILFHVSADAGWSNLPLSGLFVDMLKKIVDRAGLVGQTRRRPPRADVAGVSAAAAHSRRVRQARRPAGDDQAVGRRQAAAAPDAESSRWFLWPARRPAGAKRLRRGHEARAARPLRPRAAADRAGRRRTRSICAPPLLIGAFLLALADALATLLTRRALATPGRAGDRGAAAALRRAAPPPSTSHAAYRCRKGARFRLSQREHDRFVATRHRRRADHKARLCRHRRRAGRPHQPRGPDLAVGSAGAAHRASFPASRTASIPPATNWPSIP